MAVYAREGVGHLWLVDPIVRTTEVYRLAGDRWMVASVHGGDDPVRAEPFADVAFDAGRWWLEPEPYALPSGG